jgi:hypothetical protein
MKKILTTLAVAAVASAAFAQGYVSWSLPFTVITAQTNATVYSPLFGGGSANGTQGVTASGNGGSGLVYDYELLYNTAFTGSQVANPSIAALSTWFDAGLGGTNGNTAGRLATTTTGNQTVPWANLTTNNIVLVGWSANLGTSWSVVSNELAQWTTGNDYSATFAGQNVFFGESTTGYLTPNLNTPGAVAIASAASANGLPINGPFNTQLYLLPTTVVPEPSTMALAGLGGLSMLLFRRKK